MVRPKWCNGFIRIQKANIVFNIRHSHTKYEEPSCSGKIVDVTKKKDYMQALWFIFPYKKVMNQKRAIALREVQIKEMSTRIVVNKKSSAQTDFHMTHLKHVLIEAVAVKMSDTTKVKCRILRKKEH